MSEHAMSRREHDGPLTISLARRTSCSWDWAIRSPSACPWWSPPSADSPIPYTTDACLRHPAANSQRRGLAVHPRRSPHAPTTSHAGVNPRGCPAGPGLAMVSSRSSALRVNLGRPSFAQTTNRR
jgi:hypothetical protein